MLDAKCPDCGKKARVDNDFQLVECGNCGYSAKYNEYLETMKTKAQNLADDYQTNWDRRT
jgi:Zn ribbon nucleic-acid-binding protein